MCFYRVLSLAKTSATSSANNGSDTDYFPAILLLDSWAIQETHSGVAGDTGGWWTSSNICLSIGSPLIVYFMPIERRAARKYMRYFSHVHYQTAGPSILDVAIKSFV